MSESKLNSDTIIRLEKAPSGVRGLDEITGGGLPKGRPTLVCGGPGCGKTVLAMEFLVHGAREFNDPGLFVSFEESPQDLMTNFNSFGLGADELIEQKKLKLLHVAISREEIVEAGGFSLDALTIRLEHGIQEIGARRIVLDTMETIFAVLSNSETLRSEIARLFHWLRDRGVTAVVTGESGIKDLTRHGFEEYISDCVVVLDHRVAHQISKRRLRVIKYRGSAHAKDEFPFIIGKKGISVFPIISVGLDNVAAEERISTGVHDMDNLLEGKGYFRGSTVLISGNAGTGKSSLAMAFAVGASMRGEHCIYFTFEESASQLTRNLRSIGVDIAPHLKKGTLNIQASRPTFRGLEEHLVAMTAAVEEFRPACVVMDPITDFTSVGVDLEVKSMLTRGIDYFRHQGITLVLTALTSGVTESNGEDPMISSLIDTWVSLQLRTLGNRHRREIFIIKSRGMQHSSETLEMKMSSQGLSLLSIKQDVKA